MAASPKKYDHINMIMPSGRGIPFYILLLALLWPTLVSAISIELVPSSSEVVPGDVLTVQAIVSGLASPGSPSLSAYDVTVHFDPALFAHTSTTFSNALGDPGIPEALVNVFVNPGELNVTEVSLLPLGTLEAAQGSSFLLFTTQLTAIGVSAAPTSLSITASLAEDDGTPLAVATNSVVLTTVGPPGPLPVPIPLLSSPSLLVVLVLLLLLIVWLQRRRFSL